MRREESEAAVAAELPRYGVARVGYPGATGVPAVSGEQ